MKTVVVAAAVIERNGRILVTRRLAGTHLAGAWEFPGGKCDRGESLAGCMRRELREELGIDAVVGEELFQVTHDYPDTRVELHFLRCDALGEPVAILGQDMRWLRRDQLNEAEFPPADAELIRLLTATPA
jgi:mutator protein MutT